MKYFWIVALLVVGACGKVDVTGMTQLGTAKPIKPDKLSTTEIARIQLICDALRAKDPALVNLVNLDYTFAGSTKGCTDSAFAQLPDTTVRLVDTGGYKFLEGSTPYYFSDFETSSSGVLSQICNSLSLGVSPIVPNSSEFIFFSINDSSDCMSGGLEQCIVIERGNRSSDSEAIIHTREWIKVKLQSNTTNNVGFWTYKKRVTQASCAEGSYIGRSATLK